MRFSVRDQRLAAGAARATLDVTLRAAAADATLAELLELLAHRTGKFDVDDPGLVLELDGLPVSGSDQIADLPLRAGSQLRLGRAGGPPASPGAAPEPLVELTQVAGPDCGMSVPLGRGSFVVGPGRHGFGYGRPRRPALRIDVAGYGSRVASLGDEPARLDGRSLTGDKADADDGALLTVGGVAFRLATATPAFPTGLAAETDRQGRMPLIRTPRVAAPVPAASVPVPDPPVPAQPPAPMSWLLMLAPLPVGVVLALVFSPFFLIMTVMTPVMGLARWLEGRFRARREAARIAAESAAGAARFADDLDATRAAVAAAARSGHPDLGELWRRARTGRNLWQVRPGDPDELRLCLGIGILPWQPELGRAAEAVPARPELAEVARERAELLDVPVLADLRECPGLGVVGSGPVARRVAAAVLLDLVTRHGPADAGLVLLVEPGQMPAWDWAKWLPHLAGEDGEPRVATDPEAAIELLSRPLPGLTVVVVDGDQLLTGPLASLLGRLGRESGRALVVTSRVTRLPSVCRSFVEIARDGSATFTNAATGERTTNLTTTRAAPAACAGIARALAGWTDPEQVGPAAQLPDRVRMLELLLAEAADRLGRPVATLDAAGLADWWRQESSGLQAILGVTDRGPLRVDLLSDGPHGLVVGTTGAGKSELLRALVGSLACRYSPDRLTFLLVDFKGGGAFDACADLPHTVGLVTDLDEQLAARALRCLRAEVRYRERRLRDAGVSDLRDHQAGGPPLPRLVIVIDEFATLAVELPGFLSALIDVAQRGRSLGIHLLLATQRPQGVVDGKIRANTNLRIALRVQDDADSRDVLGTRHAADLDRRRPGRGYVRLGAGEIVPLQSALVSATTPSGPPTRIEVEPFRLVPATPAAGPAVGAEEGSTDLVALVAAAAAAAANEGYEPPRVPWPPPLPDQLDAWTLPAATPESTSAGVPLGRVDLPDEQRSDVWWWRPEAGGMLVLGADPAATAVVVASACLGLARHRPPDQQTIYVLDGGYGLGAIGGLPQVAAVVAVDDTERMSRVLDWLDAELTRRRADGADPGPEILVVVAGWSAVVEGAEHAGLTDAAARLERLLRDGAAARIRLLISGAHERSVPGRVTAQLPVKLCLRLADPASYVGLGLRVREVPELAGLRAIDLATRHELVIGRYHADPADPPGAPGSPCPLADAVARIADRYPDAVPTPAIGVLPERVPVADVLGDCGVAGSSWRLGLGRFYRDLRVAELTLAPGMHAVVAGPPGSGRTTALRALAAAARAGAPAAPVCVVASDPAAWDPAEVTELAGSFEDLRRWPPDGRGLLLVDGVEALGPAAGTALDRLLASLPADRHVVVAGRPEAFRGMQPWQRTVTLSRTGLLLRPGPEDGDILRTRLPREPAPRPVPGRGYLVDAAGLAQVQAAFLPPPDPAAARTPDDLDRMLSMPGAFPGAAT